MEITNLPLEQLVEAPWNPNSIDEAMLGRLRRSLQLFGLVQNLVVRPVSNNKFEVLSGNQRLRLLREAGWSPVPCCVVYLDDIRAKLLAQVLNRVHGEDDLGLKAEVVRDLLKSLSEDEISAILPDSPLDLAGLANLGQETMAGYLKNWEQARSLRLRNFQFRLTEDQLELVQKALSKFYNDANRLQNDNPNLRGNSLYLMAKYVLKRRDYE